MKIGLVCPYNIARGGGVLEIVRDMKRGLQARGHEVRIITPKPREDSSHYDRTDVIFLGNGADFRSPLHTTSQFSATIDPEEIDHMLEREQFDILHFHEPWVPVLSRQILARSKAVNIATFHAKVPETIMSRTLVKVVTPYTKSMLRYLHALTAVSDAAAEYVGTLTDDPITIIPNGIDLKRYTAGPKRAVPADKTVKTILYVGRLERRKGVKYLLRAYEQLCASQTDVQLIIAGDGPDREKLEMQVETQMLRNVTFLGFVSDDVKLELLRSADLFCVPSLYGESFGLVLLEAMACELVTVAGDNPGYVGVMQEMGELSLVNPQETDEFARRLRLLLNEPKLRQDWQRWAKQYVKQFDYPAVIDAYEDFYEYSLAHHSHKVTIHEQDDIPA